jgi:hypothetical protein
MPIRRRRDSQPRIGISCKSVVLHGLCAGGMLRFASDYTLPIPDGWGFADWVDVDLAATDRELLPNAISDWRVD